MKKLLLLLLSIAVFSVSFGAATIPVKPALNANEIYLPVGKSGQRISLMQLSKISLKDFETLTHRKMRFFDRLAFKSAQKKLNKGISEDGTIKKKKLQKFVNKFYGGETGFHAGGFFLGFLLGAIGLVIAYVINDDYKRNRVKWAWIGFGIAVVINIILIVAILNGNGY
jgi:hypothetical protein